MGANMKIKSVYKILLFTTMLAGVTGAGIGCYYLMKSKQEARQNAIERSNISYQVRPAYQFKTALEQKNTTLAIDLLSLPELDPNHPYCKEHSHTAQSNEDPLLIEVVRSNMPRVLEELLKRDIDLFAPSCEGKTAIEESILFNQPEMLDLLLKKAQLDINAPYQKTGETLLHLAINAQAKDVTLFLLHQGANPWAKNQKGIPAIEYEKNEKVKAELLQTYQTNQKTNPQEGEHVPAPKMEAPVAPTPADEAFMAPVAPTATSGESDFVAPAPIPTIQTPTATSGESDFVAPVAPVADLPVAPTPAVKMPALEEQAPADEAFMAPVAPTPADEAFVAPVAPTTTSGESDFVAPVAPVADLPVAPTPAVKMPTLEEPTPADEEENTLSSIEAQGIDPFADM